MLNQNRIQRYRVKQPEFDNIRKKLELSYQDLADRTGLSKTTLIDFAHGRITLRLKSITAIINADNEFTHFCWAEEVKTPLKRRSGAVCVLKKERLIEITMDKGLNTLTEIAAATGMAISSISYWLRGYGARPFKAYQLCQRLGVEFSDLWELKDEEAIK